MFSIDYLTGKKPLWRAFWIYAGLLPLLAVVIMLFLSFYVIGINEIDWHIGTALFYMTTILCDGLSLFGLLAVWSCLKNTSRPLWSYLALVMLVIGVFATTNEYIWMVHPAKGDLLSQLLKAAFCWLALLLTGVIVLWLYLRQPNGFIKSRAVPILLVVLLLIDVVNETVFRPYPSAILFGENGDLKIKYSYTNIQESKRAYTTAVSKKLASLEAAAMRGDANSAFTLGSAYMDPSNPEANDVEAVRWLTYAVDHGVTLAKNELGILYHQGRGVEKSAQKALQLYKEGSEAGDDVATYNLGLMYELGQGTQRDYAMAAKYYKRAVQRTSEDPDSGCAENDLGALYALGKGVQQDDVEARSMFADAARKSFYIMLKPKDINLKVSSDIDFPAIYATYRLATVKRQSPATAGLSEKDIKLAKMLADRYQGRCRD